MNTNMTTFLNRCESKNTKSTYERIIIKFSTFINKEENDVVYSDIVKYKTEFSKQYSSNTMALHIRCLKSYFRFLYEEIETIDQNPTINKRGVSIKEDKIKIKNKKEYLPIEKAEELIKYAKNSRDRAFIATFITTGIRVQELINLTVEDYMKKQVTITTKGQVKRVIYFNDTACRYIDAYLLDRKDSEYNNLFISNSYTPMNRANLNNTLKVTSKRAGFSGNISNHSLRHTCVSAVCKSTDIETARAFIGHSDINTTKRYLHSTKEEVIAVGSLLNF